MRRLLLGVVPVVASTLVFALPASASIEGPCRASIALICFTRASSREKLCLLASPTILSSQMRETRRSTDRSSSGSQTLGQKHSAFSQSAKAEAEAARPEASAPRVG